MATNEPKQPIHISSRQRTLYFEIKNGSTKEHAPSTMELARLYDTGDGKHDMKSLGLDLQQLAAAGIIGVTDDSKWSTAHLWSEFLCPTCNVITLFYPVLVIYSYAKYRCSSCGKICEVSMVTV